MKQAVLIYGGLSASIFLTLELERAWLPRLSEPTEGVIEMGGMLLVLIGVALGRLLSGDALRLARHESATAGLTKRENRVLGLVDQGMSNKEIARALAISESTVKTHMSRIFAKLNARRRTEAVRIARGLRLTD